MVDGELLEFLLGRLWLRVFGECLGCGFKSSEVDRLDLYGRFAGGLCAYGLELFWGL